ncbi:unnamed protein product [Plasmodium vivax]|uniref:(malaria parasite P. vivax) hypothetical protein n=1 Tax=Plasmodium vivax TaxID=5855 RepID=A0A564ZQE5_PLAVI|nr:unnamed protein product [Plasmodium vivax]VUZ93459.1 PIR protein [Plasmodium vivax]
MTTNNYDIFSLSENYLILEAEIKRENGKSYVNSDAIFCSSLNHGSENQQATEICQDFVKLFTHSKTDYGHKEESEKSKYHIFLNYWLNNELSKIANYKYKKRGFFEHLYKNYKPLGDNVNIKDIIYEEEINYINNMNILYRLYKNYEDLKEGYIPYEKFCKELKENYNAGLIKCFNDGNYGFCGALQNFNDDYKQNKTMKITHCNDKECLTLPELNLSSPLYKQPLQVAKLGTELIGISYISSFNRKYEKRHGEYSDLKELIFLQYNLLMEQDDNEIYSVMINILHQFIQYCNENKNELKLSSFMDEFIKSYYNKKKEEYKKIFTECSSTSSANTKKYCDLYKKCKKVYNEELSLINDKPDEYIKRQDDYIKELPSYKLFILQAKALFQDFDAMSKYLPTIMSTMVASILCLTPFGSILHKGKRKKKKKIPLFYPQRRMQDIEEENTTNIYTKPKKGKIRFAYQPS